MNKTQNVVFFLGAGFSAPAGLPTMANFIDKARDLYFSDRARFATVGKTLELISRYADVKHYMSINLHNIEDLLSIAQMELRTGRERAQLKLIKDFITAVITSYTPESDGYCTGFAQLVANVGVAEGEPQRERYSTGEIVTISHYHFSGMRDANSNFGVISLNYDLLVENALSRISLALGDSYLRRRQNNPFAVSFSSTQNYGGPGVAFAKLHGSVDSEIIPPTWNKTAEKHVLPHWRLASKLLAEATHLIFLGYSLPSTDNYIKYLLASSLKESQRLKRISVIALDSDGSTMGRYQNLFPERLTFHNTNVTNFADAIGDGNGAMDFDEFDQKFSEFLSNRRNSLI